MSVIMLPAAPPRMETSGVQSRDIRIDLTESMINRAAITSFWDVQRLY